MTGAAKYSFNNLFFEATRRCNLACPMCMASSNDEERVARSQRDELSTEEIERHVLASARDIGVETITWSGGEFILRSDAVELVRLASEYGYSSIVATNGTRMDRAALSELGRAADGSLVVAVGINSIDVMPSALIYASTSALRIPENFPRSMSATAACCIV